MKAFLITNGFIVATTESRSTTSFGFPGADDLGNMFQVYDEFAEKMNDLRDVKVSKHLNPQLQNFEQWLAQNAKKIPL
jgi:hypothetical protein